MSPILGAILIISGIIGAAILALGVPLMFGVIAYEFAQSRKDVPTEARDTPLRIAAQRGVARGFVLAGGLFWSVASFAGLYSFQRTGAAYALLAAFYPLLACAVTLVVGWYFERTVAALLVLASFGVIAWGVIYQFELGVWMLMTLALVGPMLTAAVLFWNARTEQDAFEMATSFRLELAPVFSARSSVL